MTPDNSAEAQLQQELREMFLVDTQQQLETYFDIIQQLNPATWIADIQSIYRAIHTIKGGAVTVEANRMLYSAIALEDLLSDLRYLEISPPLDDGNLSEMLLEAGELLASCMEIAKPEITDPIEQGNRTQLTIQRLETLHARIKECYLPDWNEMKQVHQEFAEQGFDLVVLDLEMELANIPERGDLPSHIIASARLTIDQLTHIGSELELAPGWTRLLERGENLIDRPNGSVWRSVWLPYFQLLKSCVKNSGEISDTELTKLDNLFVTIADRSHLDCLHIDELDLLSNPIDLDDIRLEADDVSADLSGLLGNFFMDEELVPAAIEEPIGNDAILLATADPEDLSGLLGDFLCFDDELLPVEQDGSVARTAIFEEDAMSFATVAPEDLSGLLGDFLCFDDELLPAQQDGSVGANELLLVTEFTEDLTGLLDDFFIDEDLEIEPPRSMLLAEVSALDPTIADLTASATLDRVDLMTIGETEFGATTEVETSEPVAINAGIESKRGISIPVPLERLDRSAQQVVDTLLTARVVMNVSHRLQSQLAQLSVLTQESSQFVTRLRQLQDNYALLRNLSDERDSSNNVSIERYRQGYTTIVRLLENMLRMSELGQEIEATTYQNHNHLDDLDRSILRLKDGIETSRLVPFRNLTLRAKAILRDLTNRYGKPAELIAHNERVELDAGIIQQLEPALLHLLRNAYDRGLETIPQRLAAGKPAQGTISISLQRRGNRYRLEVEDDGRGIDAAEIERIAKSKGFSIAKISTTSELLAVICLPGFSSSSTVNEVSGRGVGMDVVNTQVASVGGKLSLETTVGRGTKFTIEVPVPQLLVPCVLFQVGDRTVGFPTEEVLETALVSSVSATMSADDDASLCAWRLTTSKGEVAGFDLANYWQSTTRSLPDTAVCIRTRQNASGEIWSIADDLLGQAELLINPLPSPLIAPAGLLGVSLQSDGRLISILDPIALTTKLARSVDRRSTDYNFSTLTVERPKSSIPVILIVDDAALMRRRFEASLQTHGFVTHTCNDGLEALHWLQNNPHPDLMITDVEMPNMDGFTLIDRVRQAQIEMPILVVSSRSSEEWGKEARRLGASDYLNKGFSTPELLQKVNSLLGLVTKVRS
jgi:chemotaxis protein histidine kinase CheA/CheY-like chemotaxis protein